MTTYIDVLISLIHASEMQMINMFIKEESIKIPCKDFINANTDYTRNSIKTIQDIINSSMDYAHNIFMYK